MLTRLIVVLISQYIEFLLYTWNQHNVICQLCINLKKPKITPQTNKQTNKTGFRATCRDFVSIVPGWSVGPLF